MSTEIAFMNKTSFRINIEKISQSQGTALENIKTDFKKRISESFFERKEFKPRIPSSDVFLKLNRDYTMDDLSIREKKNVCWGMGSVIDEIGIPLEITHIFSKIEQFLIDSIKSGNIRKSILTGIMFSYFNYKHGGKECELENWMLLRKYIYEYIRYFIEHNTDHKKIWLENIWRYQWLLSKKPLVHLRNNFLTSFTIRQASNYLKIPDQSWLWRDIALSKANEIATLDEGTFGNKIVFYLEISDLFRFHSNEILVALLERYHKSTKSYIPHNELKDRAIAKWGNPQLWRNRANWNKYVSDEILHMVSNWIASEDLQHFFDVLADADEDVDHDRLNFWRDYINSMTFTKIYLGRDALYDNTPVLKEFKAKNKDRLGILYNQKDANAFLMKIEDLYIVEFSKKGNACFIYNKNDIPFEIDWKEIQFSQLKNPNRSLKRFTHSRGRWQTEIKHFLFKHNIFPDRIGK